MFTKIRETNECQLSLQHQGNLVEWLLKTTINTRMLNIPEKLDINWHCQLINFFCKQQWKESVKREEQLVAWKNTKANNAYTTTFLLRLQNKDFRSPTYFGWHGWLLHYIWDFLVIFIHFPFLAFFQTKNASHLFISTFFELSHFILHNIRN